MCVDLKNGNEYQSSVRLNVLLTIAAIVLVIVLAGWCLRLLPAALDQALGIAPPTISRISAASVTGSISETGLSGIAFQTAADHFYHPGTHGWMFVGE